MSNKFHLSVRPHNQYQREFAVTPTANQYPAQIAANPHLPYLHAPPQYNNNSSPYNHYYNQSPYNAQMGGYLPVIPKHNELKATLDKQAQILEKISKDIRKDHGTEIDTGK
jgi:hypothetical protein